MNELIGMICYGIGIALLAKEKHVIDRLIGLLAIASGALLITGPLI